MTVRMVLDNFQMFGNGYEFLRAHIYIATNKATCTYTCNICMDMVRSFIGPIIISPNNDLHHIYFILRGGIVRKCLLYIYDTFDVIHSSVVL